jgi:hypothetical protein
VPSLWPEQPLLSQRADGPDLADGISVDLPQRERDAAKREADTVRTVADPYRYA